MPCTVDHSIEKGERKFSVRPFALCCVCQADSPAASSSTIWQRPSKHSALLATTAVAALVEKTCWQAIAPELELGMTTVGTSLQLAHTAPTPIGMVVQCDCEVLEVTDRRVRFGFRVYDDVTEVAGGEHERYLVDAERFLKKAESKI